MIFDNQSEIVEVNPKKFVQGCILKYYLQNMWISTILDDFLKILLQNFYLLGNFSWVFLVGSLKEAKTLTLVKKLVEYVYNWESF